MSDSATNERPTQVDVLEGEVTLPGKEVLEAIAAMLAIGEVLQRFTQNEDLYRPIEDAAYRLRSAAWGATDELADDTYMTDAAVLLCEIHSKHAATTLCEKLGLPVAAGLYWNDAENQNEAGTMDVMSTFVGYEQEAALQFIRPDFVQQLQTLCYELGPAA